MLQNPSSFPLSSPPKTKSIVEREEGKPQKISNSRAIDGKRRRDWTWARESWQAWSNTKPHLGSAFVVQDLTPLSRCPCRRRTDIPRGGDKVVSGERGAAETPNLRRPPQQARPREWTRSPRLWLPTPSTTLMMPTTSLPISLEPTSRPILHLQPSRNLFPLFWFDFGNKLKIRVWNQKMIWNLKRLGKLV